MRKMVITAILCLMLVFALGMFAEAAYRNPEFEFEPIQELHLTVEYVPMPVDYPVLPQIEIEESDVTFIAKTLWGEARGCTEIQQQAVVWCILNRVDDERFPNTVAEVITQPQQFHGYSERNPVDAELYAVALDTMARWQMEPYVKGGTGRVLPKQFVYFGGNGTVNRYRDAYDTKTANYWEG